MVFVLILEYIPNIFRTFLWFAFLLYFEVLMRFSYLEHKIEDKNIRDKYCHLMRMIMPTAQPLVVSNLCSNRNICIVVILNTYILEVLNGFL